jgi:hypothetical protein
VPGRSGPRPAPTPFGRDARREARGRTLEALVVALRKDDQDPQGIIECDVLELARCGVDQGHVLGQ